MENFIRAKFEHYNTGRIPQKALKNVLHFRSQGPVIQVFWDRGLYIKWCILGSLHNPDLSVIIVMSHVTLYEIKKECYLLRSCLVDARRMLLFMVHRYSCPWERFGWHKTQINNTPSGERRGQKAENNLLKKKFFLSCHKIWILYHTSNFGKMRVYKCLAKI